jgi:hypothetical protein
MSTHEESVRERRVAMLAAHLDAAEHELLTAIRELDESGDWAARSRI